jgi:hypothetical protein
LREAIFGNVGTIIAFKVGIEDAEILQFNPRAQLGGNDVLGECLASGWIANYEDMNRLLRCGSGNSSESESSEV